MCSSFCYMKEKMLQGTQFASRSLNIQRILLVDFRWLLVHSSNLNVHSGWEHMSFTGQVVPPWEDLILVSGENWEMQTGKRAPPRKGQRCPSNPSPCSASYRQQSKEIPWLSTERVAQMRLRVMSLPWSWSEYSSWSQGQVSGTNIRNWGNFPVS